MLNVVDEAAHLVLVWNEGACLDASERLADVASTSVKASSAKGGRMPVSVSIAARTSSSRKVSMPQSV